VTDDGRGARRPRILLAGALPGEAAGNAVSSDVLLAALDPIADVGLLTHDIAPLPTYARTNGADRARVRLGTQPFTVHGEGLLAGRVYRDRLADWDFAWVVNSRYASALLTAGVPYVIWEATTVRDELAAVDAGATRRAGLGSGWGARLHALLLPVGSALEGVIFRRAAGLFAMSAYTCERMIALHRLAPDAVEVLPHPPSASFLAALARAGGARTERDGDGTRLLFVGRVDDPRKNFRLLLDACRALRARGVPVTLTVIGPYREEFRRDLALGGGDAFVTFRGKVSADDLAAAYREHDLLVVPSRQEGFGIVVAEAFHAGLPVVSTRCGGPEGDIVESGGGVLADHSASALSDAIATLALDLAGRAEAGRRAVAHARSVLSSERFAARVAEITTRVAASLGQRARR
jgi:glycosyltransferase involved in cell wall biosynthesis